MLFIIRLDPRQIHAGHFPHQAHGLNLFLGTDLTGDPGLRGHGCVTRAVHDHLGTDLHQFHFRQDDQSAQGIAHLQDVHDLRVEIRGQIGLPGRQVGQDHLCDLRIIQVAYIRFRVLVNNGAQLVEDVAQLPGDAADTAVQFIAEADPRAHHTRCKLPAQAPVLFHDQGPGAVPGGGQPRDRACGAAAGHDHVKRFLVHVAMSPS